jgi:hypothetical protein
MNKQTFDKAKEIQDTIERLKKSIFFDFKTKMDNPDSGWEFDLYFFNINGATTDSLQSDSTTHLPDRLYQEFTLGMKNYIDTLCFKVDAEILKLETEFNLLSDESTK